MSEARQAGAGRRPEHFPAEKEQRFETRIKLHYLDRLSTRRTFLQQKEKKNKTVLAQPPKIRGEKKKKLWLDVIKYNS